MNFWYVGLEPLASRYTGRLCRDWVPAAFGRSPANSGWNFAPVRVPPVSDQIKVGKVLDAQGRGHVALSQMRDLVDGAHLFETGDVVFLQDFWTPGFEALLYALHQLKRRPRLYARNFAQSVDEYDFTYPMRSWMRPIEVGWSSALSGMFVASTVHRDQLKAAGYQCPIHVTGLPFSLYEPSSDEPAIGRDRLVVYSSRLNGEKNPWFMLEVAREFLREHRDWSWVVTTSAADFPDELQGLREAALELSVETGGRFRLERGLSTGSYLALLRRARVQFNSSLQDYVAFTMLEAAHSGCELCYPDYRSFPECVDRSRLYAPFQPADALCVLDACVREQRQWRRAPDVCDAGLVAEVSIMLSGYDRSEVNVWHQPRAFFRAEGLV